MSLKPTQNRYLRGLAHHLKVVLQTGVKGVTDAFIAELDQALDQHELIKVRVAIVDRAERVAMNQLLVERTGAVLVQSIGRTALLFRRNPAQPKIILPT